MYDNKHHDIEAFHYSSIGSVNLTGIYIKLRMSLIRTISYQTELEYNIVNSIAIANIIYT
jgi:hypothetical protein